MNQPTHKQGLFGCFRRGEHFVMPELEQPSGTTVYAVWKLTQRDHRTQEGTAVKVAEFKSKRFANAWAAQRNEVKQ